MRRRQILKKSPPQALKANTEEKPAAGAEDKY